LWSSILKKREYVPNARTRKAIDAHMETVEGKTTVRDVKDSVIKKLGIFADVGGNKFLNYLMGWYHEKMEHYNESVRDYMSYRERTGLN
tara:strand:- start:1490 stop:1756 length:267 start_codon:yes stop_codon:yes gene_type:complete